jgi:hypothetical protein
MSGTVSSSWLGQSATGLPTVGACPQAMPRASKLRAQSRVKVVHGVALVTIQVSSDIYGETRPVQGATVELDGRTARTNRAGVAVLGISLSGARSRTMQLTAAAGNTFVPARSQVKLP